MRHKRDACARVGSFIFATCLIAPFVVTWSSVFGLEINPSAKTINIYQIIIGFKRNSFKRYNELSEISMTHKIERKWSRHGYYYVHWFDVFLKYDQVRMISIVTSSDKEDSMSRACQIALDLGIEFRDRSQVPIKDF